MKATTVKIEWKLLEKLEQVKPPRMSVSAFVRDILRKDLLRRQAAEGAVAYEEFLALNPEEQSWLAEWDEADLASLPKRAER